MRIAHKDRLCCFSDAFRESYHIIKHHKTQYPCDCKANDPENKSVFDKVDGTDHSLTGIRINAKTVNNSIVRGSYDQKMSIRRSKGRGKSDGPGFTLNTAHNTHRDGNWP